MVSIRPVFLHNIFGLNLNSRVQTAQSIIISKFRQHFRLDSNLRLYVNMKLKLLIYFILKLKI